MPWFLRNGTSALVNWALRLRSAGFLLYNVKSTAFLTPLGFDSLNDDSCYDVNNNK